MTGPNSSVREISSAGAAPSRIVGGPEGGGEQDEVEEFAINYVMRWWDGGIRAKRVGLTNQFEWPGEGTLDSFGSSPLDQIDRSNVGRLKMVWTRGMGTGTIEATQQYARMSMAHIFASMMKSVENRVPAHTATGGSIRGISFSGGLSIVAAGRPALRDKVSYVMSFGGHGDLPRVMKYLASGKSLAMRLWEREEPGDAKASARRAYETVGYVIDGRAELHLEGQMVLLEEGDSWVVPKGASHRYRILEPFRAVEATSPPAHAHGRDER